MNFLPTIHEALSNLLAAKLRSLLALLGVLVGTASVVAMVSCGELATKQALKQFETLGTDLLSLSMYAEDNRAREAQKTQFTLSDVENLKQASPAITQVAPYATTYLTISYEGQSLRGNVIGATQELQNVLKLSLEEGRFISDLDGYTRYCVLGYEVAKNIQTTVLHPVLGTQLWLGSQICTVVGVLSPWQENNFFGENINQSIILPIKAYMAMTPFATLSNVIMTLQKETPIEPTEAALRQQIEQHIKGLNLYFRSAKQLLKSMGAQSRIFTLLLGLIGAISLLVGGIGIMNIMLVSVAERKKEIGIRMAIGARRRDIKSLFLMESIILSLIGGIAGVVFGIIVAFIIALFTHWAFSILITPIVWGFVVSVMVGIFFGFYPAYKAAKLDPIQILRSE